MVIVQLVVSTWRVVLIGNCHASHGPCSWLGVEFWGDTPLLSTSALLEKDVDITCRRRNDAKMRTHTHPATCDTWARLMGQSLYSYNTYLRAYRTLVESPLF